MYESWLCTSEAALACPLPGAVVVPMVLHLWLIHQSHANAGNFCLYLLWFCLPLMWLLPCCNVRQTCMSILHWTFLQQASWKSYFSMGLLLSSYLLVCLVWWCITTVQVCADTPVGSAMIRGISGGQKKRVTTGNTNTRLLSFSQQVIPSQHAVSCTYQLAKGSR